MEVSLGRVTSFIESGWMEMEPEITLVLRLSISEALGGKNI